VKFAFIREVEEEQAGKPRDKRFPVSFMCEMLEISRAGYYASTGRGVPVRAMEDREITLLIHGSTMITVGCTGSTGSPASWRRRGYRHSPKRVRRLARLQG
jgi:hypothetical protein